VAEAIPLGALLTGLARADPDRPAITSGGETITRAGLEALANRLARAYESHGARLGDMVTVALPNGIEFYAAVFALWKLGAIPQLISPALPVRERDVILALAAPSLVIGDGPAAPGGAVRLPVGYHPDPGLSDAPIEPARVSPSWKAPTSGGSTGRPKLIVSGLPGAIDPGYYREALGQRDGGVQLVCGPLYHNAPFNFSMYGLLAGQHLVVLPKFDTQSALDAIEAFGVDWISLVPTMMSRIARELDGNPGRYDISSLRAVWHGAAPCPAWLKRAWIGLVGAPNLHEMYGTTEGQMMTHIDGTDWLAHPGSVSRPLWGEVKILGPDGAELPPGTEGELYTRPGAGQPPSYRYIGAQPRQIDGWDSVGDLGWLDSEGYLYISDRRTDLIISGGANVYPAEVEGALSEHPAVVSSVVIGLPDPDLGQRVHAVIEAAVPIPDDDLRAFLGERLARYKIPRGFTFTGQPLRDDAGKVRRSDVRALLAGSESAGLG
jgi:bile acid-coenzyme A ligase